MSLPFQSVLLFNKTIYVSNAPQEPLIFRGTNKENNKCFFEIANPLSEGVGFRIVSRDSKFSIHPQCGFVNAFDSVSVGLLYRPDRGSMTSPRIKRYCFVFQFKLLEPDEADSKNIAEIFEKGDSNDVVEFTNQFIIFCDIDPSEEESLICDIVDNRRSDDPTGDTKNNQILSTNASELIFAKSKRRMRESKMEKNSSIAKNEKPLGDFEITDIGLRGGEERSDSRRRSVTFNVDKEGITDNKDASATANSKLKNVKAIHSGKEKSETLKGQTENKRSGKKESTYKKTHKEKFNKEMEAECRTKAQVSIVRSCEQKNEYDLQIKLKNRSGEFFENGQICIPLKLRLKDKNPRINVQPKRNAESAEMIKSVKRDKIRFLEPETKETERSTRRKVIKGTGRFIRETRSRGFDPQKYKPIENTERLREVYNHCDSDSDVSPICAKPKRAKLESMIKEVPPVRNRNLKQPLQKIEDDQEEVENKSVSNADNRVSSEMMTNKQIDLKTKASKLSNQKEESPSKSVDKLNSKSFVTSVRGCKWWNLKEMLIAKIITFKIESDELSKDVNRIRGLKRFNFILKIVLFSLVVVAGYFFVEIVRARNQTTRIALNIF